MPRQSSSGTDCFQRNITTIQPTNPILKFFSDDMPDDLKKSCMKPIKISSVSDENFNKISKILKQCKIS